HDFNFIKICKYADATKANFHRLTDQTIQDIDFNNLFIIVDRTTSKVGQQFLYKKLIEPSNETANQIEELIELFNSDVALREQAQIELLKISSNDAYHIVSLLGETFLKKPKWLNFLLINLLIIIFIIILSFIHKISLLLLLVSLTINMLIHIWNKNNTFHFAWSIPQLNLLIDVAENLVKKGGLLYDKSVEESIQKMRSFQRSARFIRFNEDGSQSDVGQYLFDLIKAFLLIEVFMLFKVVRELKDKKSSIKIIFDYVGKVDTSISIASLRAGKLKTCRPNFLSSNKELFVKDIYHPQIKNCVKNSLAISGKSILITGSNMSGKSTFLRTLMINSILAQTIYTCFAEEFITPPLKQFSSIRIDDNLFEGKSYYFQEVSIMASLIAEVEQSNQNLFILDEVFKGTNSVERIAAAKAILSYLNRYNNIVIVSTHDIELAEMLNSEYDLYHFTETIEDGELHFDHQIKSGPLKTRNAIKLLELANYPEDIIREARQKTTTLRTSKI
ncbi:MAG: DNA mismatch repair protein MutS, partial [Cyclobacteriaceae bacterium]|nr:DNA mismatch repair protein MutS [Cyclobacteriaceae bacterium]